MDKKCEIVQDLLFGYKDNTLHNESKKLVEEHLKTCKNCNKIFQELKEEENNISSEKKEIDYLKKVRKKINKKNKLLIIIGIILTMIVIFNIYIFSYYYKEAGKLQVFLKDNITQEQMGEIENKILEIDKNANIKYYTKEDSLNEMKSKIENKELLSGYENRKQYISFILHNRNKYQRC